MPQLTKESHVAHRLDVIGRREDDIPSRVAAHDFRQHLRIAFVGAVADAQAELALEVGDGIGRDVIGPVEDIQPGTA
jgi:hypothetical protein